MTQIDQPIGITAGNVVKFLLHRRREVHVNQIKEVIFQQLGDGKGGKGGDQFATLLKGIAALLDRVDNRGIGAGAANAFGFQRLDQRRFGVTSGRLGFMAHGFQIAAIHLFIDLQRRQR